MALSVQFKVLEYKTSRTGGLYVLETSCYVLSSCSFGEVCASCMFDDQTSLLSCVHTVQQYAWTGGLSPEEANYVITGKVCEPGRNRAEA